MLWSGFRFSTHLRVALAVLVALIILGVPSVPAQGIKVPPAPQLVTDAWMLIIGFKAAPDAIRERLPQGLEAHPDHRVVMNMYTVPDPKQTSGFGAYTLTYLALEVKGHDSYTMGEPTGNPGRYFIHYFNDSPLMREFTKRVGIPAEEGHTKITVDDKGNLKSVLTVGRKPFIETTAKVGKEFVWRGGGHLNYFGLLRTERSGKTINRVMKYPIPWVGSGVTIKDVSIKFLMPKDHSLRKLTPKGIDWAVWTKGSFVYPQAQVISQWVSR